MFDRLHTFTLAAEHADLRRAIRQPILISAALGAVFFGVGGAWAGLAPIASAAIAEGAVSPESRRKTVQHLEGGIVQEVLVRDGDTVAAGQPVIVLQNVQAAAAFRAQQARATHLRATEARLEAELDGAGGPDWTRIAAAPSRSKAVADQQRVFETRLQMATSKRDVLGKRIEQLEEEIAGLKAQTVIQTGRIGTIAQEIATHEALFKKGLVRKPRLVELRQQRDEIEERRVGNDAAIARAQRTIAETRLQILGLATEQRDQASAELSEVRTQLADLAERMASARDTLERTIIRAPAGGSVIGLKTQTIGGVIRPGDAIMEIVPKDGDLLIDARIAPTDVDIVHVGLTADVTLSAFSQRDIPTLDGVVAHVSADSLSDERTGEIYYLARIAIAPDALDDAGVADDVLPGMPATVMIFTGARTLADYLLSPLVDSINKSLRET